MNRLICVFSILSALIIPTASASAGEPLSVVDLIVEAPDLNKTTVTVRCETLYGATAGAIYCGDASGSNYVFIESRSANKEGLRRALTLCNSVARHVPPECAASVTAKVFSAPIGVQLQNAVIAFD
jgi:hypothetical protein